MANAAKLDSQSDLPSDQAGVIESGKSVVLYDGHCNFCKAQVTNLRRFDVFHRLQFVSLHEPFVSKIYPDLSYDQLMEQMWVVAPRETLCGGLFGSLSLAFASDVMAACSDDAHSGADAVVELFVQSGGQAALSDRRTRLFRGDLFDPCRQRPQRSQTVARPSP